MKYCVYMSKILRGLKKRGGELGTYSTKEEAMSTINNHISDLMNRYNTNIFEISPMTKDKNNSTERLRGRICERTPKQGRLRSIMDWEFVIFPVGD